MTREELLNIIETDHVQCGEPSALARMALAAMGDEPNTDDELSNLLWYSQEATCHSDPNYYCEFQRLATPGFIAGIIRELQERRKADMNSEPYGFTDGDCRGMIYKPEHADRLNEPLPVYRHAQPAPVIPSELHPDTQKLVTDFCTALAEKLYKAQLKYGHSDNWSYANWEIECQTAFHEHIAKGDPRDVAAYCAFMWYHGWKTEAAQPAPVVPEGYKLVPTELTSEMVKAFRSFCEAYDDDLIAGYKAMLAAAPQEVK